MKYINFKRFKFSTIFKNISFKMHSFLKFFKLSNLRGFNLNKTYKHLISQRFKFSTIFKNISFEMLSFLKFFKLSNLRSFNLNKTYKHLISQKINFKKLYSYFDIKQYSRGIFKKKDFLINKFLLLHLPLSIVFFTMLYIIIPTFYTYDKSLVEKAICKQKNIKCLIKGKIRYTFFPSPRIKINDFNVIDNDNEKKIIANLKNVSVKLSFKNLLSKDKHKFKKIEINKFTISINIDNFKKYKNIFTEDNYFTPTTLSKGKIIFLEKYDNVATIKDVDLKLNFDNNFQIAELKGNFLNDDLYISFNRKEIDQKQISDIIIKMSNLNLLTKANIFPSDKEKNALTGNILFKKNKHRFTGIVHYKEGQLKVDKSNFKNFYLNGEVSGKVEFSPYFNFDLDLDLKNINFTKTYNYFLKLDKKEKKNLFKVNKKINGNLALSADKVYSNLGLVKSFESRLKFNNGNVSIEQFLINLGKLGAADILGSITNDKKFSNIKYETNIFIDNQKKFLRKFGIYSKKKMHPNLFIAGLFDLHNIKNVFYEISDDKKFSVDDVSFVEKEFNDFMLEDGYVNLFNLAKFKEFTKSIAGEIN